MRYRLRKDVRILFNTLVMLILLLGISLVVGSMVVAQQEDKEFKDIHLQQQEEQLWRLHELEQQIEKQNEQLNMLEESLIEFLERWNLDQFEATGYAPLDPRAEEGMCYSGYPEVTASGAKTTPGGTVAAGSELPFGTPIWIEGHGWREVQDRGGMIGSRSLDICVDTREEAFEIGRRNVVAVWPK